MRNDSDAKKNNVVEVDFKNASQKLRLDNLQRELNEKKRELFERWLAHGTVSVLFDARSKAVKVPNDFKHRGDLRLNFCYQFHVPDFSFNADAVWGTLSFDTGEFFCLVPWETVFGMQSGELNQGAVWFENFPSGYDQIDVLGFSEDMCQGIPDGLEPTSALKATLVADIVPLDFSKKDT